MPSTPDLLLDAASKLMAERGVDNVPIAEIVREAGQRNASAVHYHFGSRTEILRALLERHMAEMTERRADLIEEARATPETDLWAPAEAIVRPMVEMATAGWRERASMQIAADLALGQRTIGPEIQAVLDRGNGFEVWTLLWKRCRQIPLDVWRFRAEVCVGFVVRAAATRAWQIDQADVPPTMDDETFVTELIEMLLAAMQAPVTEVRPPQE